MSQPIFHRLIAHVCAASLALASAAPAIPVALGLSLSLLAAPAAAEEGPGTAAVRKANAEISVLLREKPEAGSAAEKKLAADISNKLKTFLDIDALGQRALADHWASLSAAQRKQYLGLLRGLVDATYIKALRSNLEYEVVYLREEAKDDTRRVATEVHLQRNGRPEVISVEYVLRSEAGSWRAFDLVTDGVGLVENYRGQFNQIFAKEGFAGLVERMKKKQAQASSP